MTRITIAWSPGRGWAAARRDAEGRITPLAIYRETPAEALRDAVSFATNLHLPLDDLAAAQLGAVHVRQDGV